MKNFGMIGVIIAFVVIYFVNDSFFIVHETQQAIITQFGKPVGDPKSAPGIYYKLPFVQKVQLFDRRFLEWDGSANQVTTSDKRYIWVDTYARWRITDPLLFFKRVKDERGAQTRLDDILDGETRNAIAKHKLVELIRTSNRTPQVLEEVSENDTNQFPKITFGRDRIRQEIIASAGPKTIELGIELLDLRFKRINYVEEVRRKIFDRMRSERLRIAEKYRSEGQGDASKILGNKERELKKINSEAYKLSEEIKGKADAQAAAIYSRAYNRSPDSREFYRFVKSLEIYPKIIKKNDTLVLSTKNDLFRYLHKR